MTFFFKEFDLVPHDPGVYQYAAILFTSLGGKTKGNQTHWALSDSVQACTCDCEDCEFLDHCSHDPCGFSDVIPDNGLSILEYIKDQQRAFGLEPDARFAWRRIHVGPWTQV